MHTTRPVIWFDRSEKAGVGRYGASCGGGCFSVKNKETDLSDRLTLGMQWSKNESGGVRRL